MAPPPRYIQPSDMIKSYIPNPKSVGENLAGWSKTPSDAINGLVNSTDHHQIMTNSKYTHIGVGVVEGAGGGYWWVQQFVKL